MTDRKERQASLALRNGEAKDVHRAADWYRRHGRLHCGDAITMASDALTAYNADTALGRDALLVCDTTEMVDALNQRIHGERTHSEAPTMSVARGQQVAVGDVIISRRNDPTIAFHHSTPNVESLPSVRNGNRWRVAGIDAKRNLLGAERLDDGARVLFDSDYFREHVSLGYAVTVHSAQGVTADASLAVLSESASRNLLYAAMTRGRHANHAHIYEHTPEASELSREGSAGTLVTQRGDSHEAATLLLAILAILANDESAITAHDYVAQTGDEVLSNRVGELLNMRAMATERRNESYRAWQTARQMRGGSEAAEQRHIDRYRHRRAGHGLEL